MKTAIIIGGGIAGCSTAYALAKRGIPATLIERHAALAQESSGNPVGILYPKLTTKPSLSDQLMLQGFDFTKHLLESINQPALYQWCGLLQLAHHQKEIEKQQTLIKLYPDRLVPLNQQQASAQAEIPLARGGVFWPDTGWLRPQKLCEQLARHPLINIATTDAALSIIKIAEKWLVTSKHQVLESNIVVICNAAELGQFSQSQHIPITPVRGQINFTPPTAITNQLKTVVCTDHFIAPAVEGMHSFGTSYARNRTDAALCDEDTTSNIHALRQLSPTLHENLKNHTVEGRVAWRSATQDYMPLAGELIDERALRSNPPRYNANPTDLPWLRGLYVNAGHGSKGMITAPICGELIARLANNDALGMDSKLAAKLNPSRFLLRELGLKQLSQTLYG